MEVLKYVTISVFLQSTTLMYVWKLLNSILLIVEPTILTLFSVAFRKIRPPWSLNFSLHPHRQPDTCYDLDIKYEPLWNRHYTYAWNVEWTRARYTMTPVSWILYKSITLSNNVARQMHKQRLVLMFVTSQLTPFSIRQTNHPSRSCRLRRWHCLVLCSCSFQLLGPLCVRHKRGYSHDRQKPMSSENYHTYYVWLEKFPEGCLCFGIFEWVSSSLSSTSQD